MKVIGITGKSGSGKTTLASLLAKKLECEYIDVDKIGHEALFRPEILDSLCKKFGNDILDDNGNLDRKKVGDIVFASKDKMQILIDLTWEYMKKQLDLALTQDCEFLIIDWALLPDKTYCSKYWNRCDCKILVTSNEQTRKNKIIERDHITEEYFNKRESSSLDYSNTQFDYIFNNDYNEQTINAFMDKLSREFIN